MPPKSFVRTLWSQTTTSPLPFGSLHGEQQAEVAIVGGGYSGLSAALHLTEAGHAVALIEAREPGFGASGRNAAGWLPVYFNRTPDAVETLLGETRGRALNRMVAESGGCSRPSSAACSRRSAARSTAAIAIDAFSGDATWPL